MHRVFIARLLLCIMAVTCLDQWPALARAQTKNAGAPRENVKALEQRLRTLQPAFESEKPATLRKFADQLYDQEDYYNALTVYKFLLFKTPAGQDVQDLRFRIALCYEMGERWDEAEGAFRDYVRQYPKSERAPEASYRIGQGYFRGGRFADATQHFSTTVEEFPDSKYSLAARYGLGLSYLKAGKWELSREELRNLAAEHPESNLAAPANEISGLLAQGNTVSQKSPLLAGALSIIPGLGKLYTKHYGGAVIAFLVNSGLGFVIYDSVDHQRYAVAGVFGALAAATYSANIIGGYRSAIRYNTLEQDKFADRVISKGVIPDLGLTK